MSLFSRTEKHKVPEIVVGVNSPDWIDGWMSSEAEHCYECRGELERLKHAGDHLASEVEQRWSGPGGCDCLVCTAARLWREERAS